MKSRFSNATIARIFAVIHCFRCYVGYWERKVACGLARILNLLKATCFVFWFPPSFELFRSVLRVSLFPKKVPYIPPRLVYLREAVECRLGLVQQSVLACWYDTCQVTTIGYSFSTCVVMQSCSARNWSRCLRGTGVEVPFWVMLSFSHLNLF